MGSQYYNIGDDVVLIRGILKSFDDLQSCREEDNIVFFHDGYNP
ncbi:hypothetical protein HNQ69_001088 [Bartonella callosciuri]|uniref:Uncharacterized protein n=1 Tax=Bartonella callosciuri TaxID=686223 RepID=A0A840NVI9_9HYPH|nr:hypothetical protein [Bartonella callosciuri]MBB5073955.1 hypothetical protein [Bartonella callosciuri]